jgi:hypothetical protein
MATSFCLSIVSLPLHIKGQEYFSLVLKTGTISMFSKGERLVLEKGLSLTVDKKSGKNLPAAKSYKDQVRKRARRKAKIALEDLKLLVEKYPKDLDPEQLIKILDSYLKQRDFTVTVEERKISRLPPSLGRKRLPADWSTTSPRVKGAPLMKRLGKKYALVYDLGQKLYGLRDTSRPGPLVITDEGNKKIIPDAKSNLRPWLDDFGLFDELFDFSELFPDLPLEKQKLLQKIIKRAEDTLMKRVQDIQAQAMAPKHVVIWCY